MPMARIPRRRDASTLQGFAPRERHLFESIDGALNEEDLAFVVGASVAEVAQMLGRLAAAGAIEVESGGSPPSAPAEPSETGDTIDLSTAKREEIDRMHARLARENYYELLGLARDANKDALRAAYYKTAPRYHPDRHFRKRLGPYKSKIEAIFTALTKAHDVLREPTKRRSYDATLGSTSRPRASSPESAAASAALSPVSASPVVQSRAGAPVSAAPVAASPRSPAPAASSIPSPSAPVRRSTPPPVSTSPRASTVPPQDEALLRARRDQLARRLRPTGGGIRVPVPSNAPRSASHGDHDSGGAPGPTSEPASGELRERRLRRYIDAAEQALKDGDFRGAAAAFEQAARLAPERTELAERARESALRSARG